MIGNLTGRQSRSLQRLLPKRQGPNGRYSELPLERLIHVSVRSHQEQTIIALPYPTRDIRLLDLMPMARRISEAIIKIALRQCQAAGQIIACNQCYQAMCCRQPIGLSTIEAAYLAEIMVNDSSQAAQGCIKMCRQRAQLLDELMTQQRKMYPTFWSSSARSALRFEQWHDESALDCLFLHLNKCSIYADRPLVCRHWFVTGSQHLCNASDGSERYNVSMLVNLTDVLIETAFRCSGNYEIVLLPAVINWYEQHAQQFTRLYPAHQLVWVFLNCLQDAVLQKENPETNIHFKQIR